MNIYKWIKQLFAKPEALTLLDAAPVKKIGKAQLTKMTKAQLEEKGRELGIELDKRQKKSELVNQVLKSLK